MSRRRATALIDFDALNAAADAHVLANWHLVGDVKITGEVTRSTIIGDDIRWALEARYRSEGGASRHIWVYGSSPADVAARAADIFAGPFGGFEIYDVETPW